VDASFKGDRNRLGRPVRWLACLAWLAVGVCGCANFWDEVSSNDFKFKHLFSKPDPMLVLRDSTDGDKRAAALRSLREPLQNGGGQKDQDAYVQILTAAATTDKEPLCRMAAIISLGHFKDARAVPALIQADQKAERDFTRDNSTLVRQQALTALGENRTPEARQWLIGVARASAKEEGESEKLQTLAVRLTAIRSLGKYSQYEATETLLHLLKTDRDVAVRESAHQSLELATGKRLAADPKAWDDLLHQSGQAPANNGTIAEEPAKKRSILGWR
jgi:HEAT repeat protein